MEQKVTGGSVCYQVNHEKICITSCQVEESHFEIPSQIEGKPVIEIGKKAILSNKVLKELVLPDELETVGEWAFAHCSQLESVWCKRREIHFGRGAFKDCSRLTGIYSKEEENRSVSALLAAAPVMLEAEYLLSMTEAGEAAWLQKLDARLLTLLEKPDKEGYSRQVLCGEEDLMASLEVYLSERRKQKARLCYLRLLHDIGLQIKERDYLVNWLKNHTKGCESEAAWEVLHAEHGSERDYYEVFAGAGCVTEANFDELLADMGEGVPEMKAWLLRYKEENMKKEDFFDSLSLDF